MRTQSFFSPQFSSSEHIFVRPKRDRRLLRRLLEVLREWRWRMNSRRELAALSALDLKDLGYPPQAEAEIAKPFWQV
jgi:uncharacterized protein YjiS (DUF1127 family)